MGANISAGRLNEHSAKARLFEQGKEEQTDLDEINDVLGEIGGWIFPVDLCGSPDSLREQNERLKRNFLRSQERLLSTLQTHTWMDQNSSTTTQATYTGRTRLARYPQLRLSDEVPDCSRDLDRRYCSDMERMNGAGARETTQLLVGGELVITEQRRNGSVFSLSLCCSKETGWLITYAHGQCKRDIRRNNHTARSA